MIQFNRETIFDIRSNDPYYQKAIDWCRDWLTGRSTYLLHTSGTTGVPKPIVVTANQMRASARNTGQILELGQGTRALVSLNIDYVAGVMQLVRGMELGWDLTLIAPTSNPLLVVGKDIMFDFTTLVPMQLIAILEHPGTQSEVYRLGKILLGGAGLTPQQEQVFKSIEQPLYHGYGMTETVSHVAIRELNQGKEKGFRLVDNIEYGQDERGCLYLEGEVTNGERVQTNDIVKIFPNRRFEFVGRADNIINSGGIKIQLEQVDAGISNALKDLSITNTFFTWYQEDAQLGQKLILIIEGEITQYTEEALLAYFKNYLKRYESPKHIYFVKKIITTASGKVDKRQTVNSLLKQ